MVVALAVFPEIQYLKEAEIKRFSRAEPKKQVEA